MPVVKPEPLVPIQGLVGLVNNRTPRHHLVLQLELREVDYLALNRLAMLRHLVAPRRQGLVSVLLMQELGFLEVPQSQQRAFLALHRLHQHNPPAASLVLPLKRDLVTRILVSALALLLVEDSLVSQNQVYLVILAIQAVSAQAVLPTLVSSAVVNRIPLPLEQLHSNNNSNSKHRLLIPSSALAIIKLSNKLAILPLSLALGPPRRSNPKVVYSVPLPRLVEACLVPTINKIINSSQQHRTCSVAIPTIKLALVRCLVRSLPLQAHRSLVPILRILVTTLEGAYSALHSTITVAKTSSLRAQDYSAH